jgi:hypothetical protein
MSAADAAFLPLMRASGLSAKITRKMNLMRRGSGENYKGVSG